MQFVRIVPGWWEGFFLLPRYQCLFPKCVYSFAINPSVLWAMVVALSAVETQQALLASKSAKAQRRFSMLSTGCRRVKVTATTGHVSISGPSFHQEADRTSWRRPKTRSKYRRQPNHSNMPSRLHGDCVNTMNPAFWSFKRIGTAQEKTELATEMHRVGHNLILEINSRNTNNCQWMDRERNTDNQKETSTRRHM